MLTSQLSQVSRSLCCGHSCPSGLCGPAWGCSDSSAHGSTGARELLPLSTSDCTTCMALHWPKTALTSSSQHWVCLTVEKMSRIVFLSTILKNNISTNSGKTNITWKFLYWASLLNILPANSNIRIFSISMKTPHISRAAHWFGKLWSLMSIFPNRRFERVIRFSFFNKRKRAQLSLSLQEPLSVTLCTQHWASFCSTFCSVTAG